MYIFLMLLQIHIVNSGCQAVFEYVEYNDWDDMALVNDPILYLRVKDDGEILIREFNEKNGLKEARCYKSRTNLLKDLRKKLNSFCEDHESEGLLSGFSVYEVTDEKIAASLHGVYTLARFDDGNTKAFVYSQAFTRSGLLYKVKREILSRIKKEAVCECHDGKPDFQDVFSIMLSIQFKKKNADKGP